MSATKELFGGAITVTLPTQLIDASCVLSIPRRNSDLKSNFSDFRQVPDTQEVFVSPTSSISIIVEVLESVAATDLREAAGYEAISWRICLHVSTLAHVLASISTL